MRIIEPYLGIAYSISENGGGKVGIETPPEATPRCFHDDSIGRGDRHAG